MNKLNEKDLNKVTGGSRNSGRVYYRINEDNCVQCGSCEGGCPVGCIIEGDNGYYIDANLCIACGGCAGMCPTNTIEEVVE